MKNIGYNSRYVYYGACVYAWVCLFDMRFYNHFTRLYAASVAVEMGELKLFKYLKAKVISSCFISIFQNDWSITTYHRFIPSVCILLFYNH